MPVAIRPLPDYPVRQLRECNGDASWLLPARFSDTWWPTPAGSAALKRLGVTEQMLSKVPNDASVLQELKGIMAGVGDSNIRVRSCSCLGVFLYAEASS